MSWSTSELRVRLAPLNRFKPSSKIFYWPFQGGTSFVDLLCFCSVLCLLCFVRVCLYVLCGHQGLTSWLSFVVSSVSLSLSHWYPGSGVVLDCIDSWSLQPYLLLESNNHISRFQSGFRSDRSTTDNLVRLETFIRDAFIKKEHVVAVFFDLEKVYDTTWRYGILKDIHKLGLRGRLPTFIENFLADRTMQVRVGSSLSDYYDQEQGVPQGGVLSTTLFSIKINDIVKCLGNLTDCSLYVDDFCICYCSKSMATIERQLQQNLNKIENWATSNGFKFSKSKTQCLYPILNISKLNV